MQSEPPDGPYSLEPDPAPAHPRRVTIFTPHGQAIIPADALKGRDAPCLSCGYNLRNLSTHGSCPECGVPILHSLQGPLLRFSDATYLQSLHLGASVIIFSSLGEVALIVGLLALAYILDGIEPAVLAGVLVLGRMFRATGWWVFTTPDAALAANVANHRVRLTLRTAAVAAAIAFVLVLVHSTVMRSATIVRLAWLVSGVACVVQFFASMLYMRWLASRVPDRAMQDRVTNSMWLLPALCFGGLGAGCLGPGLGCLPAMAAFALPPIAWGLYLILLWRVRQRIAMAMHRSTFNV